MFAIVIALLALCVFGLAFTSGFTLSSLDIARVKARDARRSADLQQIRLAQELYYDANGSYAPDLSKLVSDYISVIPEDPRGGAYAFAFCPSGEYHLGASFENESGGDPGDGSGGYMQRDDDSPPLCEDDPINGDDDGPCIAGDGGSHCFDFHGSPLPQ